GGGVAGPPGAGAHHRERNAPDEGRGGGARLWVCRSDRWIPRQDCRQDRDRQHPRERHLSLGRGHRVICRIRASRSPAVHHAGDRPQAQDPVRRRLRGRPHLEGGGLGRNHSMEYRPPVMTLGRRRATTNNVLMGPGVDEVIAYTGGTLVGGPPDQPLAHLYTDSREVTPGDLFVALKGEAQDGHAFIGQAIERGAGAILCEVVPAAAPATVSVVRVPDSRRALVDLTRGIVDAHPVPIVGITGSAGKTTTKEMVAQVLGRRLRVR